VGQAIGDSTTQGPFAREPQTYLNRCAVHGRKDLPPAMSGPLRGWSFSKSSGLVALWPVFFFPAMNSPIASRAGGIAGESDSRMDAGCLAPLNSHVLESQSCQSTGRAIRCWHHFGAKLVNTLTVPLWLLHALLDTEGSGMMWIIGDRQFDGDNGPTGRCGSKEPG
jgi:hypothetical protein